ncbi:MAG: hypothetical protein U0271_25405 [Polyangiaceae bacterium]
MTPEKLARCSLVVLSLSACKEPAPSGSSGAETSTDSAKAKPSARPSEKSARGPAASASSSASASAGPTLPKATAITHKAPQGTIGGTAFAPDFVRLEETGDGDKLGLYTMRADRRDAREACQMTEFFTDRELATYLTWGANRTAGPFEFELTGLFGTNIETNHQPPGKAKVTITKRDAATLSFEGTIEVASEDGTWKLAGPIAGEYCPTKAVRREKATPLLGRDWTLDPVAAKDLPAEPAQGVFAGMAAKPIALATVRDAKKYDGSRRFEFVFYPETRRDPCAERPYRESTPREWLDSFAIDLPIASPSAAPGEGAGSSSARPVASAAASAAPAAPPIQLVAGAVFSGHYSTSMSAAEGPMDNVDLRAFEPDGYRSWTYSQYYSVALALDAVDDKVVKGRVYLALPDNGKSMVVGGFEAVRCPAEP